MNVRLLFPSRYLCAADLHDKDVHLTIAELKVEDLQVKGGDSERKPVLYFEETRAKAEKQGNPKKEKRLVLNKTNALQIAALHGTETDEWVGKRITLYATMCQAFGDTVDCIRVKDTVPEPEKAKSK